MSALKLWLNLWPKKTTVVLPVFFFLLTGAASSLHAQTHVDSLHANVSTSDSSPAPRVADSADTRLKKKPVIHYDSLGNVIPDSLWRRKRDAARRYKLLHADTAVHSAGGLHTDSSARPLYSPDRLADTNNHASGRDTVTGQPPASIGVAPRASNYRPVTGWMNFLASDPWFNFSGRARRVRDLTHHRQSADGLFYLLVALLFFFAIVKLIYGKYFGNLLTLFFRVSMRQQQIREQVLQFPFPSLLLNILFFLSAGLFGTFLLRENNFGDPDRFWWLYLWVTGFLGVLYLGKYILLRLAGWIFNIPRAVETYLFIVFMTNKIVGIFLLPILVLLSFSGPVFSGVGITIALILIVVFYGYRIAGTFAALKKEIKFSRIHFFLYLCAFEIAPVLLIYKVLLSYIARAF